MADRAGKSMRYPSLEKLSIRRRPATTYFLEKDTADEIILKPTIPETGSCWNCVGMLAGEVLNSSFNKTYLFYLEYYFAGTVAKIMVPFPGIDSIWNLPLQISTRSFMLWIP